MTLKHGFTNAIPDDPAAAIAGEILPSHWNADHVIATSLQIPGPVSNTANYVTLAGSATGDPVTLTAGGSDADILVKYAAKGLGFHQFGPDTYAVAGWNGVWVGIEVMNKFAPGLAQGGYFEISGAEADDGYVFAVSTNANSPGYWDPTGGNVNMKYLAGQQSVANNYLSAGHTLDEAYGLYAVSYNVNAGTITDAYGVYAQVENIGAGTITNAYGILSNVFKFVPAGGTITHAYGIRIYDVTAGSTSNYAIKTDLGLVNFNDNLVLGTTSTKTGALQMAHASSAFLTTIQAGNAGAAHTLTLPNATDTLVGLLDIANTKLATITFVIDGGGSTITTGIKGDLEIPFACTINRVTLLADQSGSIVVDIWKDSYANYPPVVGDSITASAKPTITTAVKSQDSTLTGWTTSVSAGDTLRFNVDSITTCQRVSLSLKVTKT